MWNSWFRYSEREKLALCGTECIDLMFHAIKILEFYYWFDKNLENQENFINLVLKIENLLRLDLIAVDRYWHPKKYTQKSFL